MQQDCNNHAAPCKLFSRVRSNVSGKVGRALRCAPYPGGQRSGRPHLKLTDTFNRTLFSISG